MPDFPLVLDGSHYQPRLDIPAFKAAGVIGFIHKATEYMATPQVDVFYFQHKAECLAAGLLFGSYAFGNPGDGVVQAKFYLDTVQPDGKTLLILDLEKGMTLVGAEQFLKEVYKQVGIWCWLYTSAYVIRQLQATGSQIIKNCPPWIAGSTPNLPSPWSPNAWKLWQYGTLNFGNETFDANQAQGTEQQLREDWQMASPTNIPGVDGVTLIASTDIPTFTPDGLFHHWVKVGDQINVKLGSEATISGILCVESPDDYFIPKSNMPALPDVPPTVPPPPPPITATYYTTTIVNIRADTSLTTAGTPAGRVIEQAEQGATVLTTGTPDTTTYKWIKVVSVDGKAVNGWISSTYLTTTKK